MGIERVEEDGRIMFCLNLPMFTEPRHLPQVLAGSREEIPPR